MKGKYVLLGAILLAVIALLAGCGDDDDLGAEDDSAGGINSSAPVAREDSASGESFGDESGDGRSAEVTEESASVSADGGSGVPGEPSLPQGAGSFDRKIIETATIELEAEDVLRSFTSVGRIASTAGGFVSASNVYSEDDQRFATITIRVPASEYGGVLEQLRGLGEVVSEGSNASDVTEEYTDLGSRLRNLQSIEARYVELLGQAGSINDILTVEDRLNVTRAEIEQIQGRINVLDDLSELGTIEVFLSPPAIVAGEEKTSDDTGWQPLAPAEEAVKDSLSVLRFVTAATLAVAVYAVWLVPLGLLALLAGRFIIRHTDPNVWQPARDSSKTDTTP